MHHHHRHDHTGPWLLIALAINLVFAAAQAGGGLLAGSSVLLADAAHTLTDGLALGLALLGARLARRPAGGSYTWGWGRMEILSAQLNALLLLGLGAGLGWQAASALLHPPPVQGGVVAALGAAGMLANGAAVWALSRTQHQHLHLRAALLHTLTDVAASAAALLAGLLVVLLGWDWADPLLALLICGSMLWAGGLLLLHSSRVLLEAAPADLDPRQLVKDMVAVPGVLEVHELHVWSLTSGFCALSAHVLVQPAADCHQLRRQLAQLLQQRYQLRHTTLQMEHRSPPLQLGGQGPSRSS